jgi:hypothetical protein
VDRAEAATNGGLRPDDAVVQHTGNVLAAWPTKLALAPRLTDLVLAEIEPPPDTERTATSPIELPNDWPTPAVAIPPWEMNHQWNFAGSDEQRSL